MNYYLALKKEGGSYNSVDVEGYPWNIMTWEKQVAVVQSVAPLF